MSETPTAPLDLDAIEARARAAAERNGEHWWTARLGTVDDSDDLFGTIVEGSATPGNPRGYSDSPELWDHESALGMFSETALHVATMNPATTLALVAEVRRLRALEASLIEERDEWRETFDTGRPDPLVPGRALRDTRPAVDRRFVTPWERVE